MGAAMADNIFAARPKLNLTPLSDKDIPIAEDHIGKLLQNEIELLKGYYNAYKRSSVAALIYWHENPEGMKSLQNKLNVWEARDERSHSKTVKE